MPTTTIYFAILLIVTGAIGFIATGSQFPTSLIPTYFGIVLLILGVLARSDNSKRRMLFMHLAVTLALLGFLGTVSSFAGLAKIAQGQAVLRPPAVEEKAAMAVLTLIYVVLYVRSFIVTRRARG